MRSAQASRQKRLVLNMTNPALVLLALVLFASIPFFFGAIIFAILAIFDFEITPEVEPDEED